MTPEYARAIISDRQREAAALRLGALAGHPHRPTPLRQALGRLARHARQAAGATR